MLQRWHDGGAWNECDDDGRDCCSGDCTGAGGEGLLLLFLQWMRVTIICLLCSFAGYVGNGDGGCFGVNGTNVEVGAFTAI